MVNHVLNLATGLFSALQARARRALLNFQSLHKTVHYVGLAHRVNLLLSFKFFNGFGNHERNSLVLVVGDLDLLGLFLFNNRLLILFKSLLSGASLCLELLKI